MYQIISSALLNYLLLLLRWFNTARTSFYEMYKSRIIGINLQLASDCLIIHLADRLRKEHLISLQKAYYSYIFGPLFKWATFLCSLYHYLSTSYASPNPSGTFLSVKASSKEEPTNVEKWRYLFYNFFVLFISDYHGWIDIKDIVWPGNALKPPEGIPEKRFIRVTFLEEDPYVMLGPPSSCSGNKGVLCMLTDDVKGLNLTEEKRRDNSTVFRCCSGFCVDLVICNVEPSIFELPIFFAT